MLRLSHSVRKAPAPGVLQAFQHLSTTEVLQTPPRICRADLQSHLPRLSSSHHQHSMRFLQVVVVAIAVWTRSGLAFVHSPRCVHLGEGVMSRRQATSELHRGGRVRMGLADDMVPAIRTRYGDIGAERVVDAWNKVMAGKVTRKEWDGRGSQMAASYVDGLEAEPWHNVDRYPWISSLEEKASVIRDELHRVLANGLGDGAAWVPAAEEDAEAYGPGWQKLVLQNRSWNSAVCDLFPETCEILRGCDAPSHEILFARQRAGTGIKPHTDNSNFFITAHLPLEVPDEGRCWIRVGTDEKREWRENKALAFDSSFVHETENGASSDRIVLLVRFWHPQLTKVETNALGFIFTALDDPSIIDQPCDSTLDTEKAEADLDSTLSENETSTSASVTLDDGPGEVAASPGQETAQEEGSREPPSVSGDVVSHEAISVEPLGDAAEAERLDGFLADLKAEGLLPGAGTKDDVLAQGPKNRSERRKATKARKKASRAGKGKER